MCQASSASSRPRTQKGAASTSFSHIYKVILFLWLAHMDTSLFGWFLAHSPSGLRSPYHSCPWQWSWGGGGNGEPTGKLKFYWAKFVKSHRLCLLYDFNWEIDPPPKRFWPVFTWNVWSSSLYNSKFGCSFLGPHYRKLLFESMYFVSEQASPASWEKGKPSFWIVNCVHIDQEAGLEPFFLEDHIMAAQLRWALPSPVNHLCLWKGGWRTTWSVTPTWSRFGWSWLQSRQTSSTNDWISACLILATRPLEMTLWTLVKW